MQFNFFHLLKIMRSCLILLLLISCTSKNYSRNHGGTLIKGEVIKSEVFGNDKAQVRVWREDGLYRGRLRRYSVKMRKHFLKKIAKHLMQNHCRNRTFETLSQPLFEGAYAYKSGDRDYGINNKEYPFRLEWKFICRK